LKVHPEPLTDVTRYIESHKHLTLEDREAEFQSTMWRIERFKHVDETTRMLEIGIGTGWFPIMCKMKGLSCKGIEISPQLVEFAMEFGRRHGVDPDIEVGNVEEADLGESVYDIVIAASVFEHVEDWRRGIQTIYRALRPAGVLYFNSTNRFSLAPSQEYHFPLYGWLPDAWRYRLRKSRQGEDIMKLGIDFNQFTYPQLRRFFKHAGFRTVLDLVDMFDADNLRSPKAWKKHMIKGLQRIKPLKHLFLVFAPGTTFVCIKK
jgi:SAM-dependent methyltransferase